MASSRFPLLRGKITSVDTYQSPQPGRGSPPRLPSLDPHIHAAGLLAQLKAIHAQVEARTDSERDELANREIVAIRAFPETDLTPDQLDDSKQAWLVGAIPETGTLLVDASDGELGYLRKKIEAFDDDAKVKQKTSKDGTPKLDERGNPLTARASERAIAPIEVVKLAELDDVAGPRLRKDPLQPGQPRWLELTCRGGYRRDAALTATTQSQMARQLHSLGALPSGLEAFSGPEHRTAFLRAGTVSQTSDLRPNVPRAWPRFSSKTHCRMRLPRKCRRRRIRLSRTASLQRRSSGAK